MRIHAKLLRDSNRATSPFVISDGAQQRRIVTQPHRVRRQIEWRAPKVLFASDHVPEDLADAKKSQPD